MSEKVKHTVNSEKDFLRYSANKMTERERNAFEKNLLRDSFESEAEEGFSSVSEKDSSSDLKELKSRLHHKTKPSGRYIMFRYAAGLALILSVSLVFYYAASRKISDQQKGRVISESDQTKADVETIPEPQIEIFAKPEISKPVESKKSGNIIVKNDLTVKDVELDSVPAGIQEQSFDFVADSDVMLEIAEIESEERFEKRETSEMKTAAGVSVSGRAETIAPVKDEKGFRGRIISSDDYKPVMGASVVIKGTSTGTVTDLDGAFELPTPSSSDSTVTLRVSFIGMEQQEILADAGNELNIVLHPSELSLNEVVVTGYGTKRKEARAGSIEIIEPIYSVPLDGQKSFEKYIRDNQIFPQSGSGISKAKVVLEFMVDENGRPTEIKAIQSPGVEFSDEAIRLLTNGPGWTQSQTANSVTQVSIILSR